MFKFPCIGCGACCMAVGDILSTPIDELDDFRQEIEDFPYKAKENGHCEKLVDGKCSVYENRPDLCNVDKKYDTSYKDVMSRKEYHNLTKQACCSLIKAKLNWTDKEIDDAFTSPS